MKSVKIGIIGFGTVGSGTAKVLTENRDIIEKKTDCQVSIKTICVRDINKTRKFTVEGSTMTDNAEDILRDPEINIVVEVMGGIEKSKKIIEEAFRRGKHVVTANKDLIAEHGKELTELARQNNLHFFYEAAVAGGIPILRSLQYSLTGNRIQKIGGIINGSTNYILTRTEVERLSLETIIEDAKSLGYLESDPSADLDGLDAARKCAILASIGFNSLVTFNQVYVSGIRKIELEDIEYADKMGYSIKLLAVAENREDGIVARVHPALIPKDHPLASVQYAFNAVYVIGDMVGETMFYGKGAGDLPTGSAVANDVINICKSLVNDSKAEYAYDLFEDKKIISIEKQYFQYYMRLKVERDKKTVSNFVRTFEYYNIPIYSINQWEKEDEDGNKYDEYIAITNKCRELDFERAIEEINMLSSIIDEAKAIRIERGL